MALAHAQCAKKLSAWRATTTPALHRMHQHFGGLLLLSQLWQPAARNSPNASTLRWPASTFKFNSPNASTLQWPASTFQTVATSSAKFSERIHVRHVRHATATSTYVVLPAEATSTRLPPAPGQELRRHVRQLQVDTADDYYDDYDDAGPVYSKPGDRD